jgi:D-arabinose 1-dehydrogenase-like Zn-dependent alcohol dehydrogenase
MQTGIGGGVALTALLFCVARGATVFVSSSSPETIAHAVKLGAKGGVNYRDGTPTSHPLHLILT